MIVLDASLVVELLVSDGATITAFRQSLIESAEEFAVPHLLDIEVLSALRKLNLRGRVDSGSMPGYLKALASIAATRYPHEPLLSRIWELRHTFTAYDASYIALAEATGATLYTLDAKLRTGHRANVVYLGSWIM